MKPNGTIRYAALVAALLCATVTSCRRAAGEPALPEAETAVQVGFRISLGALGETARATRAGDYDDGRGVD